MEALGETFSGQRASERDPLVKDTFRVCCGVNPVTGIKSPSRCSTSSWAHLQKRADELELPFIVTHYPPGASKWNPVEHRLFCFISMNWAGQPLVSFETVLKFIRTTIESSFS